MKTMYFDNGCRVCRAGALLAGKAGMASDSELNELQTMSAEVSCDLDAVRYCNEIAVYDKESKESRYGIKGMVWFVEDKWGKWVNVFLLPPIYQFLNFFYHIFSYNRKMIAPVYSKVENDCEPQFHWGYRLGYMLLVSLVLLVIGGWLSLLFLAVPPVMFFIFSLRLIPEKMEFLGHLATIVLFQFVLIFILIVTMNLVFLFSDLRTLFMIVFLIIFTLIFYPFSYLIYSKRIRYLAIDHRLIIGFSLFTFFVHVIFLFWFIYQVI